MKKSFEKCPKCGSKKYLLCSSVGEREGKKVTETGFLCLSCGWKKKGLKVPEFEIPLHSEFPLKKRIMLLVEEGAEKLELSWEVVEMARRILEEYRGNLCRYTPSCFASALLYISASALGERRTQQEVARVFGRSEGGVRRVYCELRERMPDLYPGLSPQPFPSTRRCKREASGSWGPSDASRKTPRGRRRRRG